MQEALTGVRSFKARWSCHQAVLSLKCDKVTCKLLRHARLCWDVVSMLKASFDTIHQYKAARAKVLIATGIDVAIHCICVERDLCAAPLDAILAEIEHCEIVHDDSSHTMSPACFPRSSAQVMTPPSPTTMMPSSPPSHTHPAYFLCGCSIINNRGVLPVVVTSPSGINGSQVGQHHAPLDCLPMQTASLLP